MKKEELIVNHHGRNVSVSYYTPSNERTFPVVLVGHGYNGHQTDFDKTCEYFAETGIACAALTFCGGSTRDVSGYPSTEMSLFTEKEDLIAVFEYIQKDSRIEQDKIFLFGGSQGGLVSSLAAADLKEKIAGLILLYPAFLIPDDWRKTYPKLEDIPEKNEFWELTLGKRFFVEIHDFNAYEIIGAYEGPVLIMQGSEDEIVPLNIAEKGKGCYKKCNLEVFAREPHGFSEDGNRRMEAMMLYFIHDVIGR